MTKFLTRGRIGGLLLLAFCIVYAWLSQKIHLLPFQLNSAFHARTMPEVLAVMGVGLSVLVIVLGGKDETFEWRDLNWPLGLAFLLLMSVYGFAVRPAGFLLSTSLFLMVGFAMLEFNQDEPWWISSLMIAAEHQGQGYGRMAMAALRIAPSPSGALVRVFIY